MGDWRLRFAHAVKRHGANKVAKATGIPRGTVVSVVAGTAREGSNALAEQRQDRLEPLESDAPNAEETASP